MPPIGYIAGALAWGFLKAKLMNAHGASFSLPDQAFVVASEEGVYRFGLERFALRGLVGADPTLARLAQAGAFALIHPGNELDAFVGGLFYSYAWDAGGPATALAAHFAHNFGVHLGAT